MEPDDGLAGATRDKFSQVDDRQARSRIAGVPSSYLVRFATLTAVWAYAVSQPVFSFLRGSPEFLVLRDATRMDTILFAIALAVGPSVGRGRVLLARRTRVALGG